MATFQVPQFIETKAKIVGPLNLMQFFYVGVAAAFCFVFFNLFEFFFAAVLSAIVGVIGLALAFAKVNGQDLPQIILAALNYFWQPKIYTWQRMAPTQTFEIPEESTIEIINARKNFSLQATLKNLAQNALISKISPLEKMAQQHQKEFQVVRELTGEREVAKKVDY
ncbi:MAG: PrgI family protein [bacterium]|nr:PrgI family protein [bacterium]